MSDKETVDLRELVGVVGRYPEEAFVFVRDGLNFAVEQIHGVETQAHRALARFLSDHDMDWNDLITQYHAGELDEVLVQAIEDAGGCDNLNRHVGGRELCWGLRDYGLKRWGLMARTVLDHWKVRTTTDFGRIVFSFIEQDLMQKQDGDTLEDFEDVYSFEEAFDRTFRMSGDDGEDSANDTED